MKTARLEDLLAEDVPGDSDSFARFGEHSWPSLGLTACLCRFSVARFDDKLFARHGVPFSPSLSRSVRKRRAEFLAGRLCAAQALTRLGAPGLVLTGPDRSPVWPVGMIGSITHCDETAIAVAQNEENFCGVGIDLERRAACRNAALDVRHFATDAERGVLAQAGIASEDHAVIAFSMKESFFKAAYPHVGRYFGFSAVSIVGADRSLRKVSLVVAQDLGVKLKQGLRVAGEYVALGDAFMSTAVTIPVMALRNDSL
ncbi:4'-phosphopantetheinyl transferase family protein [Noviherbaspirillum sp. ST9]|uniref:4'-phosphopantetheinyl transferase family protein n=1 Tax=Noviherbaspirillum sp. ST9 TaxID=3401606 RepID=UPI003B589B8A